MDKRKVNGYEWTNERHLDYLNSMEASFVRTMMENNDRLPRMDRYLPDDSDSTLNLKMAVNPEVRRRRYSTSDILEPRVIIDGRVRGLPLHSYSSYCQDDQVVPFVENTKIKEKGKDKDNEPCPRLPPTPTSSSSSSSSSSS